jgi:hypothetical protein
MSDKQNPAAAKDGAVNKDAADKGKDKKDKKDDLIPQEEELVRQTFRVTNGFRLKRISNSRRSLNFALRDWQILTQLNRSTLSAN